jgi:hypothetical protein
LNGVKKMIKLKKREDREFWTKQDVEELKSKHKKEIEKLRHKLNKSSLAYNKLKKKQNE